MHPTLWPWPPVTSYGICMLVGLIAGWFIARRQSRRLSIDPSHVDLLAPLLVFTGLLGAFFFGFLTDAAAGEAQHGRVLYGALLVAVTAGIAYCFIARIPLGDMGDAFAAPVALGIAFGRAGCFLAGCCWGKACPAEFPLGVRFPTGSFPYLDQMAAGSLSPGAARSLPLHPTQLYESAGAAVIAAVLLLTLKHRRVSGELFLWMGFLYAALRFAVEFLRADNPPVLAGQTFSQVICLLTAAACAAAFCVRRLGAKRWRLLRTKS